MKFSTWRAASQRQRYGPAVTTVQPPSSSSGTSGRGQRGSASATQISPYRSWQPNAPMRALRGHPGRVLQLGNGGAAAVGAVTPAVVGADELVAADPAEGQRRAPVHAQVGVGARPAVLAAPQDERLAEQVGMNGPVGEVTAERDRMPAVAQRGHIGERPRRRCHVSTLHASLPWPAPGIARVRSAYWTFIDKETMCHPPGGRQAEGGRHAAWHVVTIVRRIGTNVPPARAAGGGIKG